MDTSIDPLTQWLDNAPPILRTRDYAGAFRPIGSLPLAERYQPGEAELSAVELIY